MASVKFPEGFLFGAATAAHQVEGNNTNSDWWDWEEKFAGKPGGPAEKSGIACDSYNRFEEDFDLAQKLNHNVHRLSISWARVEPRMGEYDQKEIEHYRKVLKSIKSRGMKTFVTLWHFDMPIWLREMGGWGSKPAPKLFASYAEKITKELDEHIDFYATLNEPQVYLTLRHLLKMWMPHKSRGVLDFVWGLLGLKKGHKLAYKAIKKVNPDAPVGIVENIWFIEAKYNTFMNRLVQELRKLIQCRLIFIFTKTDFLGVNYYFHDVVGPGDWWVNMSSIEREGEVSDWGWQIYPEGIYHVAKELKKYKKPIYITENGIADAKDAKREEFIVKHLYWLQKAISEGADVRGYLHWSLIDNFEWSEGYKWKFGLIEIDRANNLERKIRSSALTYARICKEKTIPEDLLRRYGLVS